MAVEVAIIVIISLTVVFVIIPTTIYFCFLCLVCCKFKRQNNALMEAPVVITQQTYQPNVGPYPVSVQASSMGGMQPPQPMHPGAYPMPQPIPASYPPMPHAGVGNYPMPQPSSAYPPQSTYPIGPPGIGMIPYPPTLQQGPVQNPPSYDQAVTGEGYQKQSPYNPNYGAN